jgi:beta-lactamase regulating signal transducer with metallopeptidase domain
MIGFPQLLAPELLRTIGMTLIHFLWQGAALAALAAATLAATKRAAGRYVIGVVTLALMIAAPVITFFVIQNPAMPAVPATQNFIPAVSHVAKAAVQPAATISESYLPSANVFNWLVGLWFAGVLLFSLRTAGGFFLIARLRRKNANPLAGELLAICREMQKRLGITRAIRYCQGLHLDAPAVLGWFRPVVMLPMSALTGLTETQLRAVIAHELAHIRRFDAFFNLLQVAAETLLFYHPAVWWLNKRIRVERENCCDDVALSVCGDPTEYARALAQMEEWRVAPSLAMAANRGPLASRVARLLGLPEKGSNLRNSGIAFGVLCLAVAMIAGNAFFGVVRTASAHTFNLLRVAQDGSESAIVITAPRPAPAPRASVEPLPVQINPAPQSNPTPQAQTGKGQSYIDSLKAEGFDNLDADDLISLKVQDVTPEYIHQIRAEGFKPSVDELIGLKVQGVTPEYIRKVRSMDANADLDEIISMKVQDITPEYAESMRKLGFKPDMDQLIGMKVQGITAEYVDEMRKIGFQPDADQIIGMKVQGITPEYVRELNELNIHPDADNVIGMKVQGIDANYIRSIRATGLNPDNDNLIGLKVQGITAEYIKTLQAAGFKPDADEVIGAKVMNITPEFIELARSHGFKDLDLDKLIQLKQADVLE